MTNYVRSANDGYVIKYEGTDFDDNNWDAQEVPASEYDGDVDALPKYDSVGQPWHVEPPPELTRTQKLKNLLGQHNLTLDDLVAEIEAAKAAPSE